ncbi:outer membrane beta-barrel protein [Thiohalorhabdus methylotrophus]|uniref:Outer membrane beta-barrel protein n=1 Tax=Thiohalorhabdus methylotrophus TaxID=3242694 RepID=A0ABV4TVD3_9GAMM
MIRRTLGAGVLITGLAVGSPAAGAQNPGYLGAGLAVQSVPGFDDGVAMSLKAGVRMDRVSPGFGLEGELTHSLFEPERDGFRGGNGDVSFTTLGGYATYMVPLPDRRVSLKGRLGLLWEDINPEGDDGNSEIGLSWGLGGQYRFNSQVSGFVEYTRIEADLSHLTGGMLLHF